MAYLLAPAVGGDVSDGGGDVGDWIGHNAAASANEPGPGKNPFSVQTRMCSQAVISITELETPSMGSIALALRYDAGGIRTRCQCATRRLGRGAHGRPAAMRLR